jgi:PIN domain nuclease of toxin-antitoxin system
MRLLLDTHILIWALGNPARLDTGVRSLIEDGANDVLFSAASIWEIAIKAQLRRIGFDLRPEDITEAARATGFDELPVRADAAALVMVLPMHHRDPFDRLLVAQAMIEPMRLYTADPQLPPYSELVTLVR